MGLMDLLKTSDPMEKFYAAAEKSNVPQGGVTGAAFKSMFPYGLGNKAFGREPEPMPDMASPQGTQVMAELVQNVVGPGTFIGPKGLARLFGDDAAKGMLATAESKLAQGVPRESVFQELGVFKGPEGKWRYEVDDSGAMYRPGAAFSTYGDKGDFWKGQIDVFSDAYKLRQIANQQGGKFPGAREEFIKQFERDPIHGSLLYAREMQDEELSNFIKEATEGFRSRRENWSAPHDGVLRHDELYTAYPDMKGMRFEVQPQSRMDGANGRYTGDVVINADSAYGLQTGKSIDLHELQHAVQGREGFAAGGSPQMFDRGQMFSPKARDLNADLSEHLSGGINAQPQEIFDSLKYGEPATLNAIANRHGFNSITEAIDYLKTEDVARTPFGQYQRLAGEAESRAVQDRMNMTMPERRASFPRYATRDDLIVRGNGGGGLMAAIGDDWQPLADRIKNIRRNISNAKQEGNAHPVLMRNMNDQIARLEQEILDSGGKVDPKLVGYEWKSKDGEVYSRWDDGAVSKRISDWENKEVSGRSGRDIVHTYFIRGADGTARPFGKQSAIKELVESGVATTPRDAEFMLKKIKEQGR